MTFVANDDGRSLGLVLGLALGLGLESGGRKVSLRFFRVSGKSRVQSGLPASHCLETRFVRDPRLATFDNVTSECAIAENGRKSFGIFTSSTSMTMQMLCPHPSVFRRLFAFSFR